MVGGLPPYSSRRSPAPSGPKSQSARSRLTSQSPLEAEVVELGSISSRSYGSRASPRPAARSFCSTPKAAKSPSSRRGPSPYQSHRRLSVGDGSISARSAGSGMGSARSYISPRPPSARSNASHASDASGSTAPGEAVVTVESEGRAEFFRGKGTREAEGKRGGFGTGKPHQHPMHAFHCSSLPPYLTLQTSIWISMRQPLTTLTT